MATGLRDFLPKEKLLDWYRQIVLIRKFEKHM
jgi:TPP-dependent pyruvate/acetoin dehydrogenase alpha subunit